MIWTNDFHILYRYLNYIPNLNANQNLKILFLGPMQVRLIPKTNRKISLLCSSYLQSFINIGAMVPELSRHKNTNYLQIRRVFSGSSIQTQFITFCSSYLIACSNRPQLKLIDCTLCLKQLHLHTCTAYTSRLHHERKLKS